jgi:CDP-glycerol glycerophosphotransferase (TagB/SpsB family)
MGEAVIQQLVATGKYDLLIKVHDHPKLAIDWAARLAPLTSAHTRIVRDFDVIPLLYAADLLLSDASSVSNEYSLLDRPMVFLDVPRLLDKAMSKNPSLDLATWGRRAGIIAKKPEEVASAVAASLGDMQQHSDLRRAMAADLFYNPGSAASAAMEWLRSKWG